MEGGIRIPSVPPAANTPVEKLSLYFSFFNGRDFTHIAVAKNTTSAPKAAILTARKTFNCISFRVRKFYS